MALAGRPADAIQVLETAARAPDADARVRQNLALAFALNGDWTNARAVAAQDVPADQLDARIQQWMQLASPGNQSTAVASLIGVTPAAVDPGQPVQLALRKTDSQMAQVAPVPAPAPTPAPQPQVAEVVPPPPPAPIEVAEAAPQSTAISEPAPAPEPVPYVNVARKSPKAVAAKPVKSANAPPPAKRAQVRTASVKRGGSTAVVQLGAYGNANSVLVAWNTKARKFRSLQAYTPMSARFASPKGTFYRLSVKGFGSVNEALALCTSLRRSGGSCFVRNVAGDAPVNIASAT
jgi:outer membrane biosynthesis protein TonB